MMNLRVLEHDCLTCLYHYSSFNHSHLCTITHPSLLDDLLFDGYLYSLGTYVCVGITIQEKGGNCFDRYLYSWGTCK